MQYNIFTSKACPLEEKKRESILRVITYFEVFDYPLTIEELAKFTHLPVDELAAYIDTLNDQNVLSIHKKYVGIGNVSEKVSRREVGNKKAALLEKKATKNARQISRFPFVRGVLISGSFSKGFVAEDGDIDYFIVTQPGRLWIARTFLILYKKLFLFNSHEYFCVNYFVDEDHLEIEEKNIFTATEIITLLPKINDELYNELIKNNSWITDYYPGLFHEAPKIENSKTTLSKKVGEALFSGKLGNRIDDYFMKVTLKRWKKKFGSLSDEDFDIAMKTSTNVSKHHPNNFQKKVLEEQNKNYQAIIALLDQIEDVKTTI